MPQRTPLSPERIVAAAALVADRGGLVAVSMRNVGGELGVEAMSLYHHLPNKDALLDGLADWVFTGIDLPAQGAPWREAMTARAASSRARLTAHPWGLGLIESRPNPGPALLRHHDAVLGCLLDAGFPLPLAVHAFSAIDAYVFGFVLTEQSLPFDSPAGADDFAAALDLPEGAYPNLERVLREQVAHGSFTYGDEFEYGLDLILDGLTERLAG